MRSLSWLANVPLLKVSVGPRFLYVLLHHRPHDGREDLRSIRLLYRHRKDTQGPLDECCGAKFEQGSALLLPMTREKAPTIR